MFIEQVIRPTGLIDPEVVVRPVENQVDDLMAEIREAPRKGLRVLVTTLTKRMAEDLTEYLHENGMQVVICTPTSTPSSASRSCAICAWASSTSWSASTCCGRASTSPKSAWSRSSTPTRRAICAPRRRSIQTIGRAARNVEGRVILYADR